MSAYFTKCTGIWKVIKVITEIMGHYIPKLKKNIWSFTLRRPISDENRGMGVHHSFQSPLFATVVKGEYIFQFKKSVKIL